MATDKPSAYQSLYVRTLLGTNERVSPANLQPGEFDQIQGMYPARVGSLERIPGHSFLAGVSGKVLSIKDSQNPAGDIYIQTSTGLYCYTLDEILQRVINPNLTPDTNPEEEQMSMALLAQIEPNTNQGGSIAGVMTGTDSSSTASTFYTRRLTTLLMNESATVLSTSLSTAGSTGSSGSFTLIPGTYRIEADLTFNLTGTTGSTQSFVVGLYNETASRFEYHNSTTTPIVASSAYQQLPASGTIGTSSHTVSCRINTAFSVVSVNSAYHIAQAMLDTTNGRALFCCGQNTGITGTIVNSVAPSNMYAFVKLLRVS